MIIHHPHIATIPIKHWKRSTRRRTCQDLTLISLLLGFSSHARREQQSIVVSPTNTSQKVKDTQTLGHYHYHRVNRSNRLFTHFGALLNRLRHEAYPYPSSSTNIQAQAWENHDQNCVLKPKECTEDPQTTRKYLASSSAHRVEACRCRD